MIVAPGSTSVSIDVFFADDAGAAATGKVASDFPACKWSGGANTADTAITLSDLAAITTAHPNDNTAGGLKEREGGWYRLDLPNNMFTSAGRKTLTFAETTNKRIIAQPIDCQYVQGDTRQISGSNVSTSTAQLGVNAVQAGGTAWGSGAITAASIAAGALTAIAAAVWEVATSGLTTAGSIGKRIVDFLTGDIYARIGANGVGLTAVGLDAAQRVKLHGTQPDYAPAVAGAAMTLTAGERTAVANEVEAQIIDDTDSEKVLQAIVDKIAATNPSLDDLTLGAIASAVRTELTTELARIDVAISTRLASAGYTVPPTAAATATAVRNELTTELARIDAATSTRAPKTATDKLESAMEQDGAVYRFTTNALEQGPSGGGSGETGGSRAVTVTVTDANSDGIEGAIVRFRSNSVQGNRRTTDETGLAEDALDDGTYTLTVTHPMYEGHLAEVLVDGDEDFEVELVSLEFPDPISDQHTSGYLTVYDGQGEPVEDVTVSFWLIDPSGTDAAAYQATHVFTATSDEEGLLTVQLLKSSTYGARLGSAEITFETGDDDTFPIPEIVDGR